MQRDLINRCDIRSLGAREYFGSFKRILINHEEGVIYVGRLQRFAQSGQQYQICRYVTFEHPIPLQQKRSSQVIIVHFASVLNKDIWRNVRPRSLTMCQGRI